MRRPFAPAAPPTRRRQPRATAADAVRLTRRDSGRPARTGTGWGIGQAVSSRCGAFSSENVRGGHSADSAAPPVRATSSVLILATSMPRARLVIDGSSSSSGGGSPLMKRSGLTRATTKLRRYGLLNPRAFSAATASVDRLVVGEQQRRRARAAPAIASASLPGSHLSTLRRIGWYAPPESRPRSS